MKIMISYYDEMNDRTIEFKGTKDFGALEDERSLKIIDDVASGFEERTNDDICVDHGGDEEWYELNVADYTPGIDIDAICQQILNAVEDALTAGGVA
jgi:hypothetical protein